MLAIILTYIILFKRQFLSILYLNYNLKAFYSYYLSYIINLATKAFIFSKNIVIFKIIIDTINNIIS